MAEKKTAPSGKRTLVELPNGTTVQVMPGDAIPEDGNVVGSEPLEFVEKTPDEVEPDVGATGEVRTAVVESPKRKRAPRKKAK